MTRIEQHFEQSRFKPLPVLTLARCLIYVLIFAAIISAIVYFTRLRYPSNLPRVFEKDGATSFRLKTRLMYFLEAQKLQREAYEKFTKRGRTVLMPGLGFRDEVLIPHSSLRWLSTQPGSKVSAYEAFKELDQIEASFPHEKFIMHPWQALLVKKDLTNALEAVIVGLRDEFKHAFDTRFGTNEGSWKSILVVDSMKGLIAQASARFTVGLPLCRDEEYLKVTSVWVNAFVMNAGVCGVFPHVLRPFVKALAYIPQSYRLRRIRHLITPLFEERMRFLSQPRTADEPMDHFQLMLRHAQQYEPQELNIKDMTCRVAVSALGAYHQTALAISNILFNLVDSDKEHNTISLIREEVHQVLAKNDGKWTRVSIAQMWKIDSICRETMRFQSFGGRSLLRQVVAKEGIVTEDGIRLPPGALVSIPSWAGQTDADIFPEPFKFDPFRYSRPREVATTSASGSEKLEEQEKPSIAPQTFVSTGVNYLPFGHGKHACPGRFIADVEMKMLLAYLVCNYDLKFPDEYMGVRPENEWLSEACLPPSGGRIMVRRRQGGGDVL